MKTKLLSAVAISALLFASCSNDNDVTPNGPQAVQFGASINKAEVPQVRAANDAWAANDAIGIFLVATSPANSSDNKQHEFASGNSFTPVAGNQLYYPMNGENVDFIAYYPYLGGQVLGNYNVNVATQTSQPAIDLLWSNNATAKNKTTPGAVAMTFDHQLSKVIINTTAGDGLSTADLLGMTVTIIGMQTATTFDLSTGSLGVYSAPADIVPATVTAGMKYEAIVLPADFAVGNLVITFTIGTDVFTWENPTEADGKFEAGKQYTYDMKITRTGVDFTCTINDWDTTPTGRTGTAE